MNEQLNNSCLTLVHTLQTNEKNATGMGILSINKAVDLS